MKNSYLQVGRVKTMKECICDN